MLLSGQHDGEKLKHTISVVDTKMVVNCNLDPGLISANCQLN